MTLYARDGADRARWAKLRVGIFGSERAARERARLLDVSSPDEPARARMDDVARAREAEAV